jgi:hypothetical protein
VLSANVIRTQLSHRDGVFSPSANGGGLHDDVAERLEDTQDRRLHQWDPQNQEIGQVSKQQEATGIAKKV